MSTMQIVPKDKAEQIERVLIGGDLAKLNADERVSYYRMVCESVGLNPLTRPFEYITLNGKLTLYARKDCTDQLRNVHTVSVNIVAREVVEGCYIVTSRAKLPNGREDESIGAVPIENLKGEARANALMKCETKSKRRVTLSICGLGILDETEIETIPSARPAGEAPPAPVKPISFKKQDSAAINKDQGGATCQEGEKPSDAADTHSTAGGVTATASVISPDRPAVKYITSGQAANFHVECRKAMPERIKLKGGDLEYTWLTDNGYINDKGEPSAAMIPADQWPDARNKACKWLRVQ